MNRITGATAITSHIIIEVDLKETQDRAPRWWKLDSLLKE